MERYRFIRILLFEVVIVIVTNPQDIQKIGKSEYYVQVPDGDGERKELENDRYGYELKGFDKEGNSKTPKFTANHPLKHDAYLRVYDKKDEVITYEEVKKEDMPKKSFQLLREEGNL